MIIFKIYPDNSKNNKLDEHHIFSPFLNYFDTVRQDYIDQNNSDFLAEDLLIMRNLGEEYFANLYKHDPQVTQVGINCEIKEDSFEFTLVHDGTDFNQFDSSKIEQICRLLEDIAGLMKEQHVVWTKISGHKAGQNGFSLTYDINWRK